MPQYQDACALLDADHQKVDQLFMQFQQANDMQKAELARIICEELTVHTQIEEEIFYPAFARATGDQQLVQHSRKEHQEAKDLVAKIEGSGQPDPGLMTQLQKAVQHHVQEERTKMFPEARNAKGMDLTQLAQQLEARKAELMAHHA